MRGRSLALLAVASLVLSILSASSAENLSKKEPLPPGMEEIMGSSKYAHSWWGALVLDLDKNQTLLAINPDKMFVPASTTKLFTVAAALDILGSDHRFETPVYARGKIDSSGRLKGDLILVASGDLTMVGRTAEDGKIAYTNGDHTYANYGGHVELTSTDPVAGLRELARQILESGVKEVDGDVIVDDRLFAAYQPPVQSELDQYIVSPIMINDNLIDLEVIPGEMGERASLNWRPRVGGYNVTSSVMTSEANESLWYTAYFSEDGSTNITIWGEVPANGGPKVRVIHVPDPASFARSLFIEALREEGVRVNASALSLNPSDRLPPAEEYTGLDRVALLRSPPFSENARLILKVSHNMHADSLLSLMASQEGNMTPEEGLVAERAFLARAGVDLDSVSLSDGSGRSPANRVTPRAVVQLLRYMARHSDSESYRDAMVTMNLTAGSDDGDGQLRFKGGDMVFGDALNHRTLLSSMGICGYMRTASGRDVALALYVNSALGEVAAAGEDMKHICEAIYRAY
jgi:D-alanyl-D-alanine carboxypeptidase/D-alanyl-D-alanine-endopeptidase (penicillin-binding protein 4)